MDDIKRYKGTDPIFSTLPPDLPTSIPLIDTVDPKIPDESEILVPQNSPTIIDANPLEPNIEQLSPNENELEQDDENDDIEKIEEIKNNPNPIIIQREKQKIEKLIMTQNRTQTHQQTRIQEELNNIDEESEPESE